MVDLALQHAEIEGLDRGIGRHKIPPLERMRGVKGTSIHLALKIRTLLIMLWVKLMLRSFRRKIQTIPIIIKNSIKARNHQA